METLIIAGLISIVTFLIGDRFGFGRSIKTLNGFKKDNEMEHKTITDKLDLLILEIGDIKESIPIRFLKHLETYDHKRK